MSDVGDFFFGTGDDPGALGTGQQRFDPYDVNRDTFYNTMQSQQDRGLLRERQKQVDARQAAMMTAEQTDLNRLERARDIYTQYERGQQAQLSPAERVQNINIGRAQGYGGAQVDPAAQARAAQLGRQDAEFRSAQTGLMGQLQEQAAGRGPSLAGTQYQQAQERNLAGQMGAAAAMGGRNSGLAQRQLAMNAASQGQQTARDVAAIRTQEQLAARQQLQGVAQTGREQDINVANAQAQLQQQTALANQAALNQRAAQQAGLTQQAGIFTSEQMNNRQLQQAQLNAQMSLANQAAGNQFALQQGQFGQQMNLANMAAANQAYMQNAQLAQQSQLANQQYYNQGLFANTGYRQQAGLANQQAQMTEQQMQDAMARYTMEAQLGISQRDKEAQMAYEALKTQQSMGYAGLEQKAYEGARSGKSAFGGLAMGALAGGVAALAMSDEDVKQSVTRGNSRVGDFLTQYLSGTAQMAGSYMTSPTQAQGSQFQSGLMKGFSMTSGMGGGGGSMGGMMGGAGGAAGGGGGIGTSSAALSTGGGGAAAGGGAGAAGAAGGGGAAGGLLGGAGGAGAAAGGAGAAGGAASMAPMAAAASDKQAKNLKAENDKLKAIMGGAQQQQQGGEESKNPMLQGFNTGFGAGQKIGGMFMQPSAPAAGAAPAQTSPAMPGYLGQGMTTPDVAEPAPVTWGTPEMYSGGGAAPTSMATPDMAAGASQAPVTWGTPEMYSGVTDGMSSSPIGAKTGVTSGNMQIGNFLSAMRGGGGQGETPTTYDAMSGGGMDVMGSLANHNAMGTAYAENPTNYSDYAGLSNQGPRSGPSMGPTMGMSDKASKEDIKSVLDEELSQFLNKVHPYEYSYKNPELPGRGYGRYVSPMAQELEKTDLGKSAVKETPTGKMVDYGKLGGIMLASQAYLNQRLNELEASQGKKGKK